MTATYLYYSYIIEDLNLQTFFHTLRDANTSASVIQIINLLDQTLGSKTFDRLFPVILTDNGSEFSNPKAIEQRIITYPCVNENPGILLTKRDFHLQSGNLAYKTRF